VSPHLAAIIVFANSTKASVSIPESVFYATIGESLGTRQFGATATQTLFNGFQTANRTRQAESQVAAASPSRRRYLRYEFDTRPGDPRS
jgi:hypothetical protein